MTLPRVQPIIPTWRREPFEDPEWLFDFKYDGFRGLCYIEQGRSSPTMPRRFGCKGVAVNFLSYGFHGVPKGNGAFVYFEWDRLATRAIGTH